MKRGRELFKKYKRMINLIVRYYSLYSPKHLQKILIRYRNINGKIGLLIRYAIIKNLAIGIGDNVSIHPNVCILEVEKLSIGSNVSIHPMSYIDAHGGLTIGDDVSIAHGVTIMTSTHIYDELSIPIKDQGIKDKPVVIKDNVWIGAKAVIIGGNTVNRGSIIGAGAVLTGNTEPDSIYVGVPARFLRKRG